MTNKKEQNKRPTGTYVDRMLGRYEVSEGSCKKFWECLSAGSKNAYVLRWGRVGTKKPQSRQVDLNHLLRRIRKLGNKGYKLVDGSFKTHAEVMQSLLNEKLKFQNDKANESSDKKKPKRKM